MWIRQVTTLRLLAAPKSLDVEVLRARYTSELAWQSTRPEREALRLQLWVEIIDELLESQDGRPEQ